MSLFSQLTSGFLQLVVLKDIGRLLTHPISAAGFLHLFLQLFLATPKFILCSALLLSLPPKRDCFDERKMLRTAARCGAARQPRRAQLMCGAAVGALRGAEQPRALGEHPLSSCPAGECGFSPPCPSRTAPVGGFCWVLFGSSGCWGLAAPLGFVGSRAELQRSSPAASSDPSAVSACFAFQRWWMTDT